ncbi:exonuclease subunit SbcD [Thalassotalea sp. G2M2-11]|uniref:exonuclease subunit SbcD n=1 Tax=Thalassotalea sp. G2M2-11 TaxID=2787627 RepID=UPI0019D1D7CC|nr:exonuclease subunit SbcD [Thalassotalea sp. G2M2-11]
MTFRVLHTSDWHLGQNFYGKSRIHEHQAFIEWLLEQVTAQSIDVVIIAGDIFDTGTPPSYARELYFDFIVRLNQLHCQLIVVAGNHDSVAMLGESKTVLATLGCHVVPQALAMDQQVEQIVHVTNKNNEQAVICAMPFIRPRDVLASVAGQSAKEKQQQLQQAISEHYQSLADCAKARFGDDCPMIATGHLTTVGVSCTESVRDIYIGTLEAFPASQFPEFDYIALGHIHQSQRVAKTDHIRYCGSPIALSFDEWQQQKVVHIADFSRGKLSQVTELAIPCFQPLAMVKTEVDELESAIDKVLSLYGSTLKQEQKLWLDIELSNGDYLNDLSQRVDEVTQHYPVEVLLIRRAKQQKLQGLIEQENTTLSELSYHEVFATRLAQEDWSDEQALARKQRLTSLFESIADQALNPVTDEDSNEQASS